MTKILIIDDKEDNLLSIKALLKMHRPLYHVLTAQSGNVGVKIAKTEKPDTILLDIIMPVMDGYEVCKQLMQNAVTKYIPIIFLTAVKTSTQDRITGLKLGAEAYLTKPIEARELVAQIEVMLRIKKAEDKLRSDKVDLEEIVLKRTFKLRESEEKYRALFEHMMNGFALHKIVLNKNKIPIDYIFVEVNDVFEDQTGLKREKIIGEKVTKILPGIENDPVGWITIYGKVAQTGKNLRFESYSESLNKWYSIYAYSPKKGYFATIFEDITEHKKAEDALKSSEERLKIIFESAPDAIYLVNFKGTFIDGNKTAEDIMGYKREELIGKNFFKLKLLPAKELIKASKLLMKSVQGKGTGPDEFHLNRKDGIQIPVEISTYPVKIKNEIVVLGIARDITERKQAEEKLKSRNKELETWTEVTTGRELFMLELKKEINELLEKSGEKPKYDIQN